MQKLDWAQKLGGVSWAKSRWTLQKSFNYLNKQNYFKYFKTVGLHFENQSNCTKDGKILHSFNV